MKGKQLLTILTAVFFSVSMIGCGGKKSGESQSEKTESNTNKSESIELNTNQNTSNALQEKTSENIEQEVVFSVDDAIKNHMKFSDYGYIADDGNVYAESLSGVDMLSKKIIQDGYEPVQIGEHDDNINYVLGSNGTVYASDGSKVFENEKIVYVDDYDASYRPIYYGVTEDGRIIRTDGVEPFKTPEMEVIEGINDAKYIDVDNAGGLAILHKDGTVSMYNSDLGFDVSDWRGIEWICLGRYEVTIDKIIHEKNYIIGIKNDGSIVAEGDYPEVVLDWKNMVYVQAAERYSGCLCGLKSDGTLLTWYDSESSWDELNNYDKLSRISVTGRFAAVGLDGTVYGIAENFTRAINAKGEEFEPSLPGMEKK